MLYCPNFISLWLIAIYKRNWITFECDFKQKCGYFSGVFLTPFRHLEENLDDWLEEELENYLDDDYLVFDCPGTLIITTL